MVVKHFSRRDASSTSSNMLFLMAFEVMLNVDNRDPWILEG